jgi:hypothetical protein
MCLSTHHYTPVVSHTRLFITLNNSNTKPYPYNNEREQVYSKVSYKQEITVACFVVSLFSYSRLDESGNRIGLNQSVADRIAH